MTNASHSNKLPRDIELAALYGLRNFNGDPDQAEDIGVPVTGELSFSQYENGLAVRGLAAQIPKSFPGAPSRAALSAEGGQEHAEIVKKEGPVPEDLIR